MNLTIDIGNTSIKVGLFKDDNLEEVKKFNDLEALNAFLELKEKQAIAICSVRYKEEEIRGKVKGLEGAIFLNHQTKIPIGLNYDTPATLGMDRLAAAIGAFQVYPNTTVLVIDSGTCITYDLIASGSFMGGMISPGMEMRFKAMHEFTANLPLLDVESTDEMIGRSTATSMNNGVFFGLVGEINHHISQLMLKYPDLKVIMTGGDAHLFESKIKSDIFVAPEIVLLGLNGVLGYNA